MFNGLLPEKELIFNKIELMDMEKLYRVVVLSGKKNFEDYVDACIRCWYNRAQIKHPHNPQNFSYHLGQKLYIVLPYPLTQFC